MSGTHSRVQDGKRLVWKVEDLWNHAKGLPVVLRKPESLIDLDRDGWFRGQVPTARMVLAHAKRIQSADLSYPVILDADDSIMDGAHRVCRAILEGHEHVRCVRLEETPPPSFVEDLKAKQQVREISKGKAQICNQILRSLPDWFGIESAIQQYVRDVETMPTFVVEVGGQIAGFLSLQLHNQYTGEIHVMGVLPEFHRTGIGRQLVQHAEDYLVGRGFEFLSVKTLSPARADVNYQKTRDFYLAMSFRPLEEFKTLWGPANPCLMLAKPLG